MSERENAKLQLQSTGRDRETDPTTRCGDTHGEIEGES